MKMEFRVFVGVTQSTTDEIIKSFTPKDAKKMIEILTESGLDKFDHRVIVEKLKKQLDS